MSSQQNMQPELRQKADDILRALSPAEREALLIKNWMSHDARWFMAVAEEYGLAVANRLNQTAAHELGKAEARRLVRVLELPPMASIDDYFVAQEIAVSFLGPDLIDYQVVKVGDNAGQMHVQRCFAYENTVHAGISESYDCGIFARITGWLDALGLEYELSPPLGKCFKAQGQDCVYTISLEN
jgi:hypothetical protein